VTEEQRMVAEFHRVFAILIGAGPAVPDEATQRLRLRLIQEEFDELKEAFQSADEAAIAKELADLLYVVYGTAVSCGIDMEPVFREVHRSNMSKVGGHKREDGKWMKPATYSPAAVAPLLTAQRSAGPDGGQLAAQPTSGAPEHADASGGTA
jgi:predicted HAD superfamily Cof-like phosphohydrolase